MRWRVVCALREVMLIFWPTRALSSVDLPTLGRPTMATRPQRCGGRGAAGLLSVHVVMIAGAAGPVAGLEGVEHAAGGFLFGGAARAAFAAFGQAQRGHGALDLEGLGMGLAAGGVMR
jgi:hypothetical protein